MPLPCDTFPNGMPEKEALLEAILFLSGRPVKTADICARTGWSSDDVRAAAAGLERSLDERRGVMLLRVAGGYQLATRPELYEAVSWVRSGTEELSPMAMEVLAIVAFKQPVTRAEIEKLRGVSSERILSTLIQQGLVVDLGRKDSPGRPILYGTSSYFLECIAMDSIDDLADCLPAELRESENGGEEIQKMIREDMNGTTAKSNE